MVMFIIGPKSITVTETSEIRDLLYMLMLSPSIAFMFNQMLCRRCRVITKVKEDILELILILIVVIYSSHYWVNPLELNIWLIYHSKMGA